MRVKVIQVSLLLIGSVVSIIERRRCSLPIPFVGGPILDLDGTQVGVVSFGLGCAREDYAGVYAKVSAVQEWLETNICELSDFCGADAITDTPIDISSASVSPSVALIRATPSPVVLETTRPTAMPSEAPTAEPTEVPSSLPSPSPSLRTSRPTSMPSQLPSDTPVETKGNLDGARGQRVCDDFFDQKFSIDARRGKRDCIWLQNQSQTVQDRLCKPGLQAYDVCEETCGKCADSCLDAWDSVFLVSIGDEGEPENRDCNWLREFPNIRSLVCVEGHAAYTLCLETCNSCAAEKDILLRDPPDFVGDALRERVSGGADHSDVDAYIIFSRMRGQEDKDDDDIRREWRTKDWFPR